MRYTGYCLGKRNEPPIHGHNSRRSPATVRQPGGRGIREQSPSAVPELQDSFGESRVEGPSRFANHYALYVLVEDYINNGFLKRKAGEYRKYEGARLSDLLRRQRELPFGAKLQNHALNSRLNDEFSKYFPTAELRPILRDQTEQRYWVTERLLSVSLASGGTAREVNVAEAIIEIIDAYVATKR